MRKVKGSATVESAYVIPAIFIMVIMIIYTVFYYHDKNILIGAAGETAALGAQLERREDKGREVDVVEFFMQRVTGKLILFAQPQVSVQKENSRIIVQAEATRRKMKIQILQKAEIVKPERKLRSEYRL